MKTPMLVIATLVIFVSGIAAAKKTPQAVTHFLFLDAKTDTVVPFNSDKEMQIYIFGPGGVIEPGAVYTVSKDGKKVLVVPPELIGGLPPITPVPIEPQSNN